MMPSFHSEALLAAGYALFLVLVAVGLERFGRHSHQRSGQFRTAGFRYHRQLDAWQCPCGHHLQRYPSSPALRTARYRAPAHLCNACAKKPDCTDSDQGREITLGLAPWIASEVGQFHRGMSVLLLVLAAFILIVESFRCQNPSELLVLGSILAPIATATVRLTRGLFPRPQALSKFGVVQTRRQILE